MFGKSVSIDDLKDDELLIIFSNLDLKGQFTALAVNKRWNSVIHLLLMLRKSLSFVNDYKDLSDWEPEEWHEVVSGSKDYKKVMFNETHQLMSKIVGKCHNLRSLDLECFQVDSRSLQILADNCPKLERLNLDSCDGITQRCAKYFEKGFNRLKYLNVSCASQITDSFICVLLKSNPNLIALNLCGTQITGECLSLLTPTVESLDISYCWELEETGISALVSANCLNLKHLAINNFDFNTANEALVQICEKFKELNELDISFGICTQKEFHLSSLTNTGFTAIARLERLESLSIKKICILDDLSLISIFQRCHRLRHLAIDMRTETTVSEFSVSMISKYLLLLESLEISGNAEIGDNAIISAINGLSQLKKLVLFQINITNKSAKFAANNCQKLRHLSLNGCRLISKPSLNAFIKSAELSPNDMFCFEAINSGIFVKTIVRNNSLLIRHLPKNIELKVSNIRGSYYLQVQSNQFSYFPKPQWL